MNRGIEALLLDDVFSFLHVVAGILVGYVAMLLSMPGLGFVSLISYIALKEYYDVKKKRQPRKNTVGDILEYMLGLLLGFVLV